MMGTVTLMRRGLLVYIQSLKRKRYPRLSEEKTKNKMRKWKNGLRLDLNQACPRPRSILVPHEMMSN